MKVHIGVLQLCVSGRLVRSNVRAQSFSQHSTYLYKVVIHGKDDSDYAYKP